MTIPPLSIANLNIADVNAKLDDIANLKLSDFPGTVADSAIAYAKQTANKVLSGPASGSPAVPTFRALVAADVPNLDASKITTGQLALARGGTHADLSATGGANQVLKQVTVGGDVTVGTLDAASITTGQLALARGGTNADLSATGGTSRVLKQTSAGAAVTVAQLAASDLSNGTTGTTTVVLSSSPTITTPTISGAIPSYNGITTAGIGLSPIVYRNAFTAQSASIASTTIYTPSASGEYRLSYYLETTTNGSGNVSITYEYTNDGTSPLHTTTQAAMNLVAGGEQSMTVFFRSINSAIKINTTYAATGAYSLFVVLERLS